MDSNTDKPDNMVKENSVTDNAAAVDTGTVGTAADATPTEVADVASKSAKQRSASKSTKRRSAKATKAAPETAPQQAGEAELQALLERQQQAFKAEGWVEYATRVDRLNRCINLLVDNSEKIAETLNTDFEGRSRHFSLMGEVLTSIGSLKFVKKNLKKWMKPERRSAPIPMNILGARTFVHYQPKGVVGIMTPWNFPVNMIFSPLADVLGAGNRAMIKPSEFAPATAQLMAELIPRYFDETEVTVCPGDVDVGVLFSGLPFDHLIFTGGTEIGRLVLQAAAPNLTPVTLELGGKSPVIIGENADITKAAENIVFGKMLNSGQACVSPDYVFIPESRVEEFIRICRNTYSQMYPTVRGNRDVTALINKRHYQRINALLDEVRKHKTRVESLSAHPDDQPGAESPHRDHRIPIQLVIDPADDSQIMQNEIFGPLIALKSYRDIEETFRFINSRPRPLALYYFGDDKAEQQRVLRETCSGGMTINDVMMQVGCDDLPFGGIGPSGMGNYRGREGFRTFSHARSVFKQGRFNLSKLFGMLPPYGEKVEKMISSQLKR